MTTECESVVSPSLGSENLPHPLTLPSNTIRNDTHSQSGISYEGRVSLISPLNSYEATMRVENPSNQFLPHNLHSPPFSSPRGYNFISHDQFGFPFSEDNRRPMFHLHPQSHSTPGSSRGFDFYSHYHGERVGEGVMQIKREIVDADLQKYSNELSKNYTESGSLNSICNSGSQTITKEEERENCENKAHNLHQDSVKETDSALSFPEHHSNKDYITNGDNSPDPISPSTFQENDDGGPCSTESDYPDPREMGEAQASLMDRSFDGSQETFQHGENSKSLRCQFCSYSTDSKTHFSSHLNCHFDHKCMKCEFTTQTIEQLKEHLQEEHGLTVEDTEVFESTRVPRVNSQGKVKTFKCKQCDYVAITKSDFWKHAKTHIKSEKLLSCSKCPFVTEYKHHLEYHLRNHFGSKPYKCNKCTYSCVNKSMLNSHMKSHSNIYQYRCSDCTYATKYCHSLKLHLRKYGHTPAMVLNPDGSPNPVPIIDIYGTRRGPKLKKDENGMPILPPQYQLQAQFVKAHMEVTGSIPPAPIAPPEKPNKSSGSNGRHLPIPSAPFPNPFTFPGNPQSYASFIPHEFKELPKQTRKHSGEKESPNDSNEKMESLNASKSPEVEESLKCELCNFSTENKDILSHHMLLHAKEEEEATEKREMQSAPTREIEENEHLRCAQKEANPVSSPFSKEQIPPAQVLPPPLSSAQNTLQEYFARAMNPLLYSPIINNQTFIHPAIDLQHQLHRLLYQSSKREYPAPEKPLTLSPIRLNSNQTESVLDLSKDQTPPESAPVQRHSSTTSPPFLTLPQTPEVSTPPSKHRRKGRAYKLERIALRLSGSGEEGESSCNEGTESQKEPDEMRSKGNEIPPLLPLDLPESKDRSTNMKLKWGEAHQCQYCDIAFKDVVMYTMHMGYHGYKDPFTCNMCGFDAVDKLSFFLHIGRSSHL